MAVTRQIFWTNVGGSITMERDCVLVCVSLSAAVGSKIGIATFPTPATLLSTASAAPQLNYAFAMAPQVTGNSLHLLRYPLKKGQTLYCEISGTVMALLSLESDS